jgi:3-deoxy-D-manno-octulosonic-acid transferase
MWRYKLLLFVFFIPLVVYTTWQSIRAFELRYFLQRLALFFRTQPRANGVWIHAASVGEVNAVLPLMNKIHEEHPETPVTLTSNTTTSAAIALKHLPEGTQHFYFPLDYLWAVKRIVKIIKPKSVFIVETEFWPNLYQYLHQQDIPLIIINGRISEKTLHTKDWLKTIYTKTLPLVTKVYARSETDKNRFIQLGANKEDIEVLGNIKFYAGKSQNIKPIQLERPYVLAASTRDDEEQVIVEAWLKAQHSEHLLVIVPRHIQRLSEILNQLKKFNLNIAIRSKNELVTPETDIYIADTMGELKQFIAGSEFALMGGSFVEKGGHNILEVAQLGKAVVFGPDMRSFADEAKLFLHHEAGIQCPNNQLGNEFNKLITDINYRSNIEKNTKALMKVNINIFNNYYLKIKNYF